MSAMQAVEARAREAARLAVVHRLHLLDTPPEERFDWVVRLAQRLFDVPMVEINLVDTDRQFTKAAYPAENAGNTAPRGWSFCARTIQGEGQLVVDDASQHPDFAENPLVNGDPHIRFYAGQPLSVDGRHIGALCLVDDKPRTMDPAELELLGDLARWVERELGASEEMRHAREIQRRLLPKEPPAVPGYEVAGLCVTARGMSGDFFDWQVIDGRLQVLVADVMGKGVGAALIGASLRTALRGASKYHPLPEAVIRSAVALEEDLQETGTFVTACVVRIDPATGDLQYVDAGHGLGLVVAPDGSFRRLASSDLPIGVLADDTWSLQADRLAPGETLLLASDGILDLFGSNREAAQSAGALVARNLPVDETVAVIGRLAAATTPEDDVTVVVVRRAPTEPTA